MYPAQRDGPLVSGFSRHGAGLRMLEVMGIGRTSLTDQAGHLCDPLEVLGRADTFRC